MQATNCLVAARQLIVAFKRQLVRGQADAAYVQIAIDLCDFVAGTKRYLDVNKWPGEIWELTRDNLEADELPFKLARAYRENAATLAQHLRNILAHLNNSEFVGNLLIECEQLLGKTIITLRAQRIRVFIGTVFVIAFFTLIGLTIRYLALKPDVQRICLFDGGYYATYGQGAGLYRVGEPDFGVRGERLLPKNVWRQDSSADGGIYAYHDWYEQAVVITDWAGRSARIDGVVDQPVRLSDSGSYLLLSEPVKDEYDVAVVGYVGRLYAIDEASLQAGLLWTQEFASGSILDLSDDGLVLVAQENDQFTVLSLISADGRIEWQYQVPAGGVRFGRILPDRESAAAAVVGFLAELGGDGGILVQATATGIETVGFDRPLVAGGVLADGSALVATVEKQERELIHVSRITEHGMGQASWSSTFLRRAIQPSSSSRYEPARPGSYLLISPHGKYFAVAEGDNRVQYVFFDVQGNELGRDSAAAPLYTPGTSHEYQLSDDGDYWLGIKLGNVKGF